jgi:methanogenic corrinoid protein MtbC1
MKSEIFIDLRNSILDFDRDRAVLLAERAVEERLNLEELLNTMTGAAREVGDAFARGDLFLPELVMTGDILLKVLPIVEKEFAKKGEETKKLGTVVIGTVQGDVHNTGKNMVSAFLTGAGFRVHDLGEDVPAEGFITAVKTYNADILAMSALMTTTLTGMEQTIKKLKDAGFKGRVKVMVGGSPITEEYADRIGADGYRPTAPGAVELARQFMKIEEAKYV